MTPRESKIQLRTLVSSRLKACASADLETASAQICHRLEMMALSGFIMAYLPIPDEPDLTPFLQTRLATGVAVPVVDWSSNTMHPGLLKGLEPPHVIAGRHGVRSPAENHPVPLEKIDAVLVPGVAFDHDAHRLGRGGGFYDRFLDKLPPRCVTIGIGFDEQLVEAVPTEQWDKQLDHVVTPQGLFHKS